MKLREWLDVRGPGYAFGRGRRLLDRYGLAASEAKERIESCVSALAEHGCAPTFPTPGRVVQRYPGYVRHLQELGAEIAVHSYDHVDLAVLSSEEARQQLLRAAEVFAGNGVEAFGFRCPYLSCTDELVQMASNGTFDYSSNKAIRWEIALRADPAHTSRDVQVLQRLYHPASARDTVCVPWMQADLVEIPVCLPDDLEVHDGLQLGSDGLTQVWNEILRDSHRRGELFDLLFHPELSRQCQQPLLSVLQEAAGLHPPVWIARLRDISTWWREKAKFSMTRTDTPSGLHITFDCSARATILAKALNGPVPQQSWAGEYKQLRTRELDLSGEILPFVGLPDGAPPRVVSFLREQGYILDIGETATRCATYIEAAVLAGLASDVELIELIEASPGPLVRYWRWPDGAKSALSITGDLDALTLLDYASRLFAC